MERIRFSAVLLTAVAAVSMTIACNFTGCKNEPSKSVTTATTAAADMSPEYRMLYGSSPAQRIQALTETEDFACKTAGLKKAAEKSGFNLTVSAEETALTYTYTALKSFDKAELQAFLEKITASESSFKALAAKMRNELLVPNATVKVAVVPVKSKTAAFEKTFMPDDKVSSGYSGNNTTTEPTTAAEPTTAVKPTKAEETTAEQATTEQAATENPDEEISAEEIVGDDSDLPIPE